jgi:peptide/nickel transport system substrate-binding protein
MAEQNKQKPMGMSRRTFLRYTALGSGAAFLAACAPAAAPTAGTGADTGAAAPADAPAETAGPQYGGTMVWMGHQEVAGLGVPDASPTVQTVLIRNIMNPLLHYNEYAEVETILADSYEVSEDGLTYTFKLHEGVLFHDGSPFTSADVKYTFDFYRNPENGQPNAGLYLGIGSVDTPDDLTVVVNMESVNAASLSNWASQPIVHSGKHAEVGEDVFRTEPIGTGAYKLKEWRAAEFTELEAFEDHFRGRPYIDVIRQDVVPEPSVRMIGMQTGEADAPTWPLLVEDALLLEADPGYTTFRTLGTSCKHIPLNITAPALAEKEVRQAMMYALDRQRIIDDLWNGAGVIAHTNLSPANTFYYNPNTKQYEYDPAKAAEMLDAAGWVLGDDGVRVKDGLRLSFECTTITGDQARRPIAELAQQMLAEVGVEMLLAEAPISTILEALRNNTMDASLFNWTYGAVPEPDPYATLHPDGGNNFTGIDDPTMNDLIVRGTQVVDPNGRKEIYDQLQELFVDIVPILFLQFDQGITPINSRIQGIPTDPVLADQVFYQAHRYWIAEA